jgi:plastocyanin
MGAPLSIVACVSLCSLAIFSPACGGGSSGSTPTPFVPANLPSPTHGGPVVIMSAQDNSFDKKTLEADANDAFSIIFVNNDAAPHNVAIYTSENAEEEIFVGETFTGPGEYREYTFDAPDDGKYFFRCDVHPSIMTGEFIVD